jgi:hypothetical protein
LFAENILRKAQGEASEAKAPRIVPAAGRNARRRSWEKIKGKLTGYKKGLGRMAKTGRSLAVTVMVACVLFSVWLGARLSFGRLYAQVEMVFTAGAEGDGLGISNDLKERITLSYDFVTVARRYLPADDATIGLVLSARDVLIAAKSIPDKYRANVRLTDALASLYQKMGTLVLGDTDAKYRANIYNNLMSRNDTIRHDPYNRKALAYNQELTAFPANILRVLTFAKAAPLFE